MWPQMFRALRRRQKIKDTTSGTTATECVSFRIRPSRMSAGPRQADHEERRPVWPQSDRCRLGDDRKECVWSFVTNSK
jgi:hypothetical protein